MDLSRNPWKAMRAEEIYLPETAQFERNRRRQSRNVQEPEVGLAQSIKVGKQMGEFDSEIASSRELLAIAWRNLEALLAGERQFRNGVEITDELVASLKQDIQDIVIRIAAYESRND
jgi:hypothetical protein